MGLLRVHRSLAARWALQQLYVRCALAPDEPWRIRQYLACGEKLVRMGWVDAGTARQQMRHTLMLAVCDGALPGFWRSACAEMAKRRFDAKVLPAAQPSGAGCAPPSVVADAHAAHPRPTDMTRTR